MESKICGISDVKTLRFLISHKYSPRYIGFIINYPKSKRFVKFENIKKLLNIKKRKSFYVAVLVNPSNNFLEKIKKFKFDYYQLYNVSVKNTQNIKKKYKKKIITAITVKNFEDVKKYKNYKKISDIILFDSKGYEKSKRFNHKFIKNIPKNIKKMLAGDIKYYENLAKFKKISDIIDLSGSLETKGKKDKSKINIFLKNLKKVNDKN